MTNSSGGAVLDGAPPNKIKLAFARAITATFNKGRWLELGLLTDTEEAIRYHGRLLKALSFGDDDYSGAVHDVLPDILGEQRLPGGGKSFTNLETVEQFVGLSHWLATNDYDLYQELYGEGTQASVAAGQPNPPTPASDTEPTPQPSSELHKPLESATPVEAETTSGPPPEATEPPPRRKVFLVHGRDLRTRDAVVALLRSFDLRVVDWDEASRATGIATPYTGDVIVAGMEAADVVVVLLTPDDVGYVHSRFRLPHDTADELHPTGQARLNVVFEAGMAMARDRERVVIVEVGAVRAMSDTAGLNVLRIADDIPSRRRLGSRLSTAGLAVHMDHDGWMAAGDFHTLDEAPPSIAEVEVTGGASWPSIDVPPASPTSPGDAVSLLKAYLPVPDKRIALEELVVEAADKVATATEELPRPVAGDPGAAQEHLNALFHLTEPVLDVLVAGIRFDRRHEFAELWSGAIRRLMQARKKPPSDAPFGKFWETSRHFPALLALRAAGTVAVHYEYDSALISMLRAAMWRDWTSGRQMPAAIVLHDYKVLDPDIINSLPMWNGTRWLYPISHYLRDILRDTVRAAIPDEDDYKAASNGYEYRAALVHWMFKDESMAYRSAPGEFVGEWQWTSDVPIAEVDFRAAVARTGDSPWTGLFGSDSLDDTLSKLRDDLGKMRKWG
jgi:predicted nucleotide-binding protein